MGSHWDPRGSYVRRIRSIRIRVRIYRYNIIYDRNIISQPRPARCLSSNNLHVKKKFVKRPIILNTYIVVPFLKMAHQSNDDPLVIIKSLKDEGNELFKEQKYGEASIQYTHALAMH